MKTSPLGPDASQWPARHWDAWDVFEQEQARLESALFEVDLEREED